MKTIVTVVDNWSALFETPRQTNELLVYRDGKVWYTLSWHLEVPRIVPCSFEQLLCVGAITYG